MPKKKNKTLTDESIIKIMDQLPDQMNALEMSQLFASILYSYDMVSKSPHIFSMIIEMFVEAGAVINHERGCIEMPKVQMH